MRIRVRKSRRRVDQISIELASMIDVVFLLLIYFIVTTVLAQNEDRLSPTLQTEGEQSAAARDFQRQIVQVTTVNGAPAYQLGERVFSDPGSPDAAQEALRKALAPLPKSEGIFIRVADSVNVAFAVGAVQAARDAGFDQVTYVPERR